MKSLFFSTILWIMLCALKAQIALSKPSQINPSRQSHRSSSIEVKTASDPSQAQAFSLSKNKETKSLKVSPSASLSKKNFYSPTLKNLNPFQKDTDYYKKALSQNLDLIYNEDWIKLTPILSDYIQKIDVKLYNIFHSSPYFKKTAVFFPSARRQLSNAFAKIYPHTFTAVYPSGSTYFMDQWALFNWSQDVLVHEMTHIYQLSQNTFWDKKLWWWLGPMAHRNSMLGLWILEGHAILNESIYGSGGRLFSGLARAFVFSQIKKDFPLKRLLHPYNDSFSVLEKYLHGGYFFAYLHSQYNLKTHLFFSESGRFFPLSYYGLNASLRRAFKQGLWPLFQEYKNYYRPLAKKQKSSNTKTILKSKVYMPMNSNKNYIYFLTSTAKSPPKLIIFNKKTGKLKKETKNLPLGKIFYKQGRYYSSAYAQTSRTTIEYSLFAEDFKPLKKYNSQQVMDIYKDKTLSLDIKNGLTQNSLLINNVFYDITHSSGVMDHRGRIHYFKQNREQRTLYRDKKPLVSFKSHFGYPVEADEEGVYFIGSTLYGSSLFVYKEGKGLFRLSSSDTITYARKIKDNKFLVSEITPTHYEYKMISTKPFADKPVIYTYDFKKENIFQKKLSSPYPVRGPANFQPDNNHANNKKNEKTSGANIKIVKNNTLNPQKNHTISEDQKHTKIFLNNKNRKTDLKIGLTDYEPKQHINLEATNNKVETRPPRIYRAFNNLSLQNLFFLAGIEPYFIGFLNFSDPLLFNELALFNTFGSKNQSIKITYSYRKYFPSLFLSLMYDEIWLDRKKDFYRIQTLKHIGLLDKNDIFYFKGQNLRKRDSIFSRDRAIKLSWSYPLIVKPEWNVSLSQGLLFGQKQFNNEYKAFPVFSYKNKPWKNYILHTGKFKYNFERIYPQAYSAHKKRVFNIMYNTIHISGESQLQWDVLIGGTEELGAEWFLTLNGGITKNSLSREPQQILKKSTLAHSSFEQEFKSLYQLSAELLKVLNVSYYPLKWPLSLSRIAPFFELSFSYLELGNQKPDKLFLTPSLGLEGEINNFFKTGLSGDLVVNLNLPDDPVFHFSVWLKGRF